MNFISMENPKDQVELKYCERCGGLFVRAQATDVVFCVKCAIRAAEFPEQTLLPVKNSIRRSRVPRLVQGPKPSEMEDLARSTRIGCLQGVAKEVGAC